MANAKVKHTSVKFTPQEMADNGPSAAELRNWKLVGRGKGAILGKPHAKSITLDRDVAQVFPDSRSVNAALRGLIQIAQQSARRRRKTA